MLPGSFERHCPICTTHGMYEAAYCLTEPWQQCVLPEKDNLSIGENGCLLRRSPHESQEPAVYSERNE